MKKYIITLRDCKLIPAVFVKETDNCVEVAKKIKFYQERRIYVLNKKGFPIGIISLVDINDRLVAKGKKPDKTLAREIMTSPIHLVLDAGEPIEEVVKKMVLRDNYYCPVVDKGKLKGIINYSIISKYGKKKASFN